MHHHITITDKDLIREILRLHRAHKRKMGKKGRKAEVNNNLIRRGLDHPETIKELNELRLLPTK